jgi:excinuclease ABC subunit B
LLREGLDLPEVTLVAILDADKEGFLRGERALIQTIGRAARNVKGRVIMYADKMTDAMRAAIGETNRRREIQIAYNERNGIEPRTIKKGVSDILIAAEARGLYRTDRKGASREAPRDPEELQNLIADLQAEMMVAAEELKFEYAAKLRDEIKDLERQLQEAAS